MKRYEAVLFDVGGPLNTEIEHERLIESDMLAAVAAAGIAATAVDLEAASSEAVRAYAPNAYAAMIWRLTGGDRELAARVESDFRARTSQREIPFDLREGMPGVLAWLHGRGLKLGLAANQPHATLQVLERHGLGQYFHHREVSGTHGYHKPDVRLFLRACEDLGVAPEATMMVGDRVDNDIYPANMLGMTTVLFRTGRHIAQRPRALGDVPDAVVRSTDELRGALETLLDAAGE